uniref:Tetratricopeptide repeat protein n=1 Tax=Romanomermis culicivorax TaxID=13658 RepID=A0A915KTU2_ROMCU
MVSLREKMVSFLSTLFAIYITTVDASLEEVERHLKIGREFLQKGQTADALTQYHAAIDNDDYRAWHGRATCYLATGKSKPALADLEKVLALKPDFTAARLQRARVLFERSDFDAAAEDYKVILEKHPDSVDAQKHLDRIEPLKETIRNAYAYFNKKDYVTTENYLTTVIESCPSNADLYEKRAACYEQMGLVDKVITDIKKMANLIPDSTEAFFKISDMYFKLGKIESAMVEIRHCLKLNPEHKLCFPLFKLLKKLNKEFEGITKSRNEDRYSECIDGAWRVIKTPKIGDAIVMQAKEHMCHCFNKEGNSAEAIKFCDEVIEYYPNNIDALCDRAEALLAEEKYDDAIRDYQSALNIDKSAGRPKEGMDRAQKLKKQSQKRDYYKILQSKTDLISVVLTGDVRRISGLYDIQTDIQILGYPDMRTYPDI